MNNIVVAKLIRLGKDGDKFKKEMTAQVERTNAKIDRDYVEDYNKHWKTRGRIYIIDEKATIERNKLLSGDSPLSRDDLKAKAASEQLLRDDLKAQATELGIEFKNNIKTDVLIKKIAEKQ